MLRRVPFDKIENFRDLGGYASNYGETSFGVVYRSGSLCDATAKDLDRMAELGIKTVIDLRDDNAKADRPDKTIGDARFKQYSLPVNGNGRIPKNRYDMVNSYIEMLEDPSSARKIFLTIARCEKPCVIHCTAGKDRTGSIIMVLLLASGVPFHDVNADYMLSFPYLTRLSRQTKRNHPDFPSAVLTPSVLFLKRVANKFTKKYGTVNQYFSAIGIGEDDIVLLENLIGKQEKSCGAVVFHENKILVEHMKKGHYSIPKGHVEATDHSDQDTALREIKEETGLKARILSTDTYETVYSPKPGVAKRVVFFVAESASLETMPQPEEVRDIYWLSPGDAIRTVTHDSDKKIIAWACKAKASF
jgi:protein tyrosine/serine phosphatase/8-oxo-dGTP pyrophosphatase MutT (NUDIX family)